ncbi:hypothetical protein BZG36_01432 [Bifiguratus adelaidae]|uniref:U3 small nucleolar RNA-associated protein 22 n=1 Tax=Bifiguratus adelaidae TaxID=1938954 RepID=A0A261Y4Z7_9FUNG|nr:hypothetical protein BZG36_01432 [Bifiguratus adelaidae]
MLSVRDASDSLPSSSSAYELYFNDRDEPTVRNLTREGRASGQLSLPSAFEKRDKISRRPTPSIVLSADVRHDTLEDLLRAKYGFRDADPLQTTTEMLPPMKQSMSAPTYYRGQSEISDAMLRQIDAYRSNDDYNSTIAKDDPDDPSLSFRKRENTSDVKQDLFSSKSHSAEVQMSSGSTPYVFESEGELAAEEVPQGDREMNRKANGAVVDRRAKAPRNEGNKSKDLNVVESAFSASEESASEGDTSLEYMESSDESEREFDEENGADDGNIAMQNEGSTPGDEHGKQNHLYAAPTRDEMQQLSEASELFKSNIFRMEVEELLTEVRIKYEKHKPLERLLHELKSILDTLPSQPARPLADARKAMAKQKVAIPFPEPQPAEDLRDQFAFEKPDAVHIVGSYPLKSIAKATKPFTVDMAVQMPKSLFLETDYKNHRYFYKRAYYVAVLAAALQKKAKKIGIRVRFNYLHCDSLKPIIQISALGDKSEFDFSKLNCIIRIIPSIAPDTFIARRLAPTRNCIRPKGMDENATPTNLPPTPLYNASILSDASYVLNLTFLYTQVKKCAGFVDACLMGRVWLHQRGLDEIDHDAGRGLNGFLWSMVMAYLLSGNVRGGRKLAAGFSSYQLFRGTMDFLATFDFEKDGLMISNEAPEADFALQKFKETSDIVVVDASGKVNLAAHLTKSAFAQVQHEAKLAMQYLSDPVDRFDELFLRKVNDPKLQFDNVFSLNMMAKPSSSYASRNLLERSSAFMHLSRDVPALLAKALTNRVHYVDVHLNQMSAWDIDASPSVRDLSNTSVLIGLVLNTEAALRLVDHGPDAENTEACAEFRALWGNKAELRRFRDGSILESVVWEAKGIEERSLIVSRIVYHLLALHYGLAKDHIQYWAPQLYRYIDIAKSVPTKIYDPQLKAVAYQPIMNAFDQLVKQMRALDDDLPLPLANIRASSSSLRYTSTFLPIPFNHAAISQYPDSARYIEPVDFILQFEGSTKWPDDIQAIQQVKSAFLLKLAEILKKVGMKADVGRSVESDNDFFADTYIDIYHTSGFTFRGRVQQDREITLLERLIKDTKTKERQKAQATAALHQIKTIFEYRPEHTFYMQNLCNRHISLSSTVRLTKRWLSQHMLANHVNDETIELICASIFLSPAPYYPPGSPLSGFFRVLAFLSTWNWKDMPLIADIEGDMTVLQREEINAAFQKTRKIDPHLKHSTWFIGTQKDANGERWTRSMPSKVIASRIQFLAKSALALIDKALRTGDEKELKRIFVTPLSDYDTVLSLKPSICTRHFQSLRPDADLVGKEHKYKNLAFTKTSVYGDQALVGFDPAEAYVNELQSTYGDTLTFFFDRYGGDKVAMVWTDKEPRLWKVNLGISSEPVDMEKGQLKSNASKYVVPNAKAIHAEMLRLGKDVVQ